MYRRKSSKCDQKWNIHLCSQTVGQSRNSKTHPKHNTRMIPFLIVDDCRHWSPPQAFLWTFVHDMTARFIVARTPFLQPFRSTSSSFIFHHLNLVNINIFFCFFFAKYQFLFSQIKVKVFSPTKKQFFFIWQKNKIFSTLWARWHHAHAVAILLVRILFCLWKSRRPMIRTAINGWKERNVIVLGYVNPTKEKKLFWYKDLDYQLFQ
jgi:hypothetical protein